MCRIAIGPANLFSKSELKRIFSYLEKSNGGHGNGVWTSDGNVTKGLKLSPKAVAAVVKRSKGDKFVFHTRLSSVGGVTEEGLHPVKAGNGYLIQNGTFAAWRSYYSGKKTTDTLALGELVEEKGLGVLLSHQVENAGVFVYMENEEIIVFKRKKRPFVLHLFESGRWLYASEDVGWLTDEDYTLIRFGENVTFRIDEEGMPRLPKNEIEPVTLKYHHPGVGYMGGGSYGSYYGGSKVANEYLYGNDVYGYQGDEIREEDIEDGEMLGIHLRMEALEGAGSSRVIELANMMNTWLDESATSNVSMCSVCKFEYEDCESSCPMYVGALLKGDEK